MVGRPISALAVGIQGLAPIWVASQAAPMGQQDSAEDQVHGFRARLRLGLWDVLLLLGLGLLGLLLDRDAGPLLKGHVRGCALGLTAGYVMVGLRAEPERLVRRLAKAWAAFTLVLLLAGCAWFVCLAVAHAGPIEETVCLGGRPSADGVAGGLHAANGRGRRERRMAYSALSAREGLSRFAAFPLGRRSTGWDIGQPKGAEMPFVKRRWIDSVVVRLDVIRRVVIIVNGRDPICICAAVPARARDWAHPALAPRRSCGFSSRLGWTAGPPTGRVRA